MIANFVLMGDLYQHNPFDFLATEWSTYPWQIGFDNGMEISSTEVVRSPMSKTNWDAGLFDDQVLDLGVSADIVSAVMFATLINLDMWGNIGSDVGNEPSTIPSDDISPGITGGGVLLVDSALMLIVTNSNSETEAEALTGTSINSADILSVSSMLVLIIADSNSESVSSPMPSIIGASVNSVTSTVS